MTLEGEDQWLKIDHVICMVRDSTLQNGLQGELVRADLLRSEHLKQGTTGEYYLFLNAFLELLYATDTAAMRANAERFGKDYLPHWKDGSVSPYGIGLRLINLRDTARLRDAFRYVPDPGNPDHFYWMDTSSSRNAPLLFVVSPGDEHPQYEDIEEIKAHARPEILEDLIRFQMHAGGTRTLQQVTLQTSDLPDTNQGWWPDIKGLRFQSVAEHGLILHFDKGDLTLRSGDSVTTSL